MIWPWSPLSFSSALFSATNRGGRRGTISQEWHVQGKPENQPDGLADDLSQSHRMRLDKQVRAWLWGCKAKQGPLDITKRETGCSPEIWSRKVKMEVEESDKTATISWTTSREWPACCEVIQKHYTYIRISRFQPSSKRSGSWLQATAQTFLKLMEKFCFKNTILLKRKIAFYKSSHRISFWNKLLEAFGRIRKGGQVPHGSGQQKSVTRFQVAELSLTYMCFHENPPLGTLGIIFISFLYLLDVCSH